MTPAATPATGKGQYDPLRQAKPDVLSPSKKKSSVESSPFRVSKKTSPRKTPSAAKVAAANKITLPTPPASEPLLPLSTFDLAPIPDIDSLNASSFVNWDFSSDNACDSSNSSSQGSFQCSPQSQLLDDPFTVPSNGTLTAFEEALLSVSQSPDLASSSDMSAGASPPPTQQSISSDPGVSGTITETGITEDDISQYMQPPTDKDGRWACTFPECNKPFGRKENLRSHVQTHLGDRQYRCDDCHKCFVRLHDLKRHAKIHGGARDYVCPCGVGFTRHDALTRHRQRGMCVGAFEGIVRKEVKRGRPRKQRPDMEERREKAKRTRQHVAAVSMSTTTSSSSFSDFSVFPTPDPGLDLLESSPLTLLADDMTLNMPRGVIDLTGDPLLFSPPLSPHGDIDLFLNPGQLDYTESLASDGILSTIPAAIASQTALANDATVVPSMLNSPEMHSGELTIVLEPVKEQKSSDKIRTVSSVEENEHSINESATEDTVKTMLEAALAGKSVEDIGAKLFEDDLNTNVQSLSGGNIEVVDQQSAGTPRAVTLAMAAKAGSPLTLNKRLPAVLGGADDGGGNEGEKKLERRRTR